MKYIKLIFNVVLLLTSISTISSAAQPYTDTPYRQGDVYWFAGQRWNAQFKPAAGEVAVMDHQEVKIVINRGDVAWNDYQAGITYAQRGEFSCWNAVPFGKSVTFEDDVMIEPGPISDRGYVIVQQFHQDDGTQGSPPFAINIMPNAAKTAEMLEVDSMYNTVSPHNTANNVARPNQLLPFTRGVVHHLKTIFVDGHGAANAGSIHVEWDGAVVLDQQGITTGYAGATNPSYPKFGLYSGNPVQTSDQQIVVHHYSPDLIIQP